LPSDSSVLPGISHAPRRITAFGLAPRIVSLSVAGILLLGVCVTSVSWYLLEGGATKTAAERVETNMRVAWDVLRANGKSFAVTDGKLQVNDHVLNDDAALVDKVKNLVGGTCTVFMGDLRVTTNVPGRRNAFGGGRGA
jgi:methyl-accepting chemotaxis protein